MDDIYLERKSLSADGRCGGAGAFTFADTAGQFDDKGGAFTGSAFYAN